METLQKMFDKQRKSGQPLSYVGEHSDWFLFLAQHRDSECIQVSNFRVALKDLGGEESGNVFIERMSHWAVGWLEYLLVNPACPEAVAKAEGMLKDLENYPVLDEMDVEWEDDEEDED